MIAAAFLLTCAAIISGFYFGSGRENYIFVVGYPADRTVLASRGVADTVTTEQNRLAAYETALRNYEEHPIRIIDPTVWENLQHNLRTFFYQFGEIRVAYHAEAVLIEALKEEWLIWYNEQVLAAERAQQEWETARDEHVADGGDENQLLPPPAAFEPAPEQEWVAPPNEALARFIFIPVFLDEAQQEYLMHISGEELEQLWEVTWMTAQTVQNTAIREWEWENSLDMMLNGLRHQLSINTDDEMIYEIAFNILSIHIQPNHFIDHEATERRRAEEEDNYQRVSLMEGAAVVREGDIVTYSTYRILEALGYTGTDPDWRYALRDAVIPLSGKFLLTAFLFLASIMYLFFYRPSIATTQKEAGLLFILYVMALALIWVLRDANYAFLPLLVFPMLVSMLIDRRCAIMLSISLVLIGDFIVDGSLSYLLFYTIASILICLLSRYTTQRSKIILVGFMVTAIQFVLSLAVAFTLDRHLVMYNLQEHLNTAGFAAMNGLLTVIICVGSLPFWEALFGVVTPIKLLDLTNPTNMLLRRLTIEAPGTYHHSLMVANLAESAAYDIGANAHAARVGGYYHDVGKLKYPHFFAENISGENPHEHLEPMQSASLIVSHVSYGLTLAAEHRLPQFVRDIIKEHHGTSLMQFFFVKAKELDPDITEADYRYPYAIPQSRESACVMLADTVEAAVRAMVSKMKSLDDIDKTIRDLIRHKLNDGQLADSQLSIKDLDIIVESFVRVLKGTHHERIAYPKLEPEPVTDTGPSDSLVIRGMVRRDK